MSTGWKNLKYRQDLPPPGGYGAVPYKRNLPIRGPNGAILCGLFLVTHGLAWWGHRKKDEFNFLRVEESKQAENCLKPLVEAERDRSMLRNWKETIESEALNIVGTGFDPTYIPGEGEGTFNVQRYEDPVMESHSMFFERIKHWYDNRGIAHSGP